MVESTSSGRNEIRLWALLGWVSLAFSFPVLATQLPPRAALCPHFLSVNLALLRQGAPMPLVFSVEAEKDLAETRRLASPLETARNEAWASFRDDAVARAKDIQSRLEHEPNGPWRCAVIADPKGKHPDQPFYRDPYKDLVLTNHASLNTLHVHSRVETPKTADVLLVGLHGAGSSFSQSGTMLGIINLFGSQSTSGTKGEIKKALETKGIQMPRVYAEAFDLPFHGGGPEDPKLLDLEALTNWFAARLRELRAHGKPIVLFTRSSSVHLAISIAETYPDLVDGFLVMSGNYPDPELILLGEEYAASLFRTKPEFRLNWNGTYATTHWEYASAFRTHSPNTFKKKPWRVWLGDEDVQTPEAARNRWRELVGAENVTVVRGGAHDLFSFLPRDKPATQSRFVEAYELLDRVRQQYERISSQSSLLPELRVRTPLPI